MAQLSFGSPSKQTPDGLDAHYGPKAPEVPFRLRSRRDADSHRATVADAAVLAALARQTFFDTFAATNDPADMALHLERAYGVDQQTRRTGRSRDITPCWLRERVKRSPYAPASAPAITYPLA